MHWYIHFLFKSSALKSYYGRFTYRCIKIKTIQIQTCRDKNAKASSLQFYFMVSHENDTINFYAYKSMATTCNTNLVHGSQNLKMGQTEGNNSS